jgi:hypothetical protein
MGFVVDKMKLGLVFSEHFSFHCQVTSIAHISPGAATIGSLVAGVPNGLKSHPTDEKKKPYGNPAFITCEYLGRG